MCVREPTCHLSRLHSLSFIKISCYLCMKLSVEVRTTQKCLGISSMLSVSVTSETWKNKLLKFYSSLMSTMPRCTQLNEYPKPLYSTQVFKFSPVFT